LDTINSNPEELENFNFRKGSRNRNDFVMEKRFKNKEGNQHLNIAS
jgi:hypothetical protein